MTLLGSLPLMPPHVGHDEGVSFQHGLENSLLLKAKHFNSLLPPPNIQNLPSSASNLIENRLLPDVLGTDVMISISDGEKFEATTMLVPEVSSWMDWWLVTVQSLANSLNPDNIVNVHCLLITRGRATGTPKVHIIDDKLCSEMQGWHPHHIHKGIFLEEHRELRNTRLQFARCRRCSFYF